MSAAVSSVSVRSVASAMVLAVVAACGDAAVAPTRSEAPSGSLSSAHFVFHYSALDGASVSTIAAAVEAQYARILDDLRTPAMPIVTVTLYPDHAALEAAVRPLVGTIPAFASGLATSQSEIHIMSPNAPGGGPIERMQSNLVHEFAHCVSLHVNPRFGNNPRWLWESVAIYESRQAVDLRAVRYMAALDPPSFETLGAVDDTRIYDVGYSIGEFIVSRWGQGALAPLIVANGDTVATLGVPLDDFQRQWFAFVRERYGL
jgi:hypothetical protein